MTYQRTYTVPQQPWIRSLNRQTQLVHIITRAQGKLHPSDPVVFLFFHIQSWPSLFIIYCSQTYQYSLLRGRY